MSGWPKDTHPITASFQRKLPKAAKALGSENAGSPATQKQNSAKEKILLTNVIQYGTAALLLLVCLLFTYSLNF